MSSQVWSHLSHQDHILPQTPPPASDMQVVSYLNTHPSRQSISLATCTLLPHVRMRACVRACLLPHTPAPVLRLQYSTAVQSSVRKKPARKKTVSFRAFLIRSTASNATAPWRSQRTIHPHTPQGTRAWPCQHSQSRNSINTAGLAIIRMCFGTSLRWAFSRCDNASHVMPGM